MRQSIGTSTVSASFGRSFWTHACHRKQSTYQTENLYNCLVLLAFSSTIFASISAVSENARENPLVQTFMAAPCRRLSTPHIGRRSPVHLADGLRFLPGRSRSHRRRPRP